MMKIMIITDTLFTECEASQITLLLREGVDRIHIRKPQASEDDLRRLLDALPAQFLPQITLQDRLYLASEYGLGGVHVNGRNPEVPQGFCGLKSRSSHSLDEVCRHAPQFDYQFLSPIFDSISKQGYTSGFPVATLREARDRGIVNSKVIALGGISPRNLTEIDRLGFGGAAFLGYIWQSRDIRETERRIREIIRIKQQLSQQK